MTMTNSQLRILSVSDCALEPGEIGVDLFAGGESRVGACQTCGNAMRKYVRRQKYCSTACTNKRRNVGPTGRPCRNCGATFIRREAHDSNRQHCSVECARQSARKSRMEFKRRRPEREVAYRDRQRVKNRDSKDRTLHRLWRKHPELPHECEACGESRVLDVAHRPEHARNGAWKTMANCTPDKIWILCPTHHALLDRLGYTAEQLGIRPREVAA
jgi:hypothetical protein